MGFKLPKQGLVFWPVGSGDSTTIAVWSTVILQLDLHHLDGAGKRDDPHTPIVDRLVELLPKRGNKPYLAVFILTHPDMDHCLGFRELLKKVTIGELWFSPRIFWEYKKDLCDDAKAFLAEAKRRVAKTIGEHGNVDSGDRVRIIGYSDLLQEDEYDGFPKDRLTVPGNWVCELDGANYSQVFRAFIHAPFKDDSTGERNETSIAMQVTLLNPEAGGKSWGRVLLFGDLSYPTIRRIFDISKAEQLAWDILLAPHHCSKSVMYWQGPGEEDERLKQDILDDIQKAAGRIGYIIASCEPIPASNAKGDNPPHAKAKARYEEIVPDEFICTQEHGGTASPQPVVFVLGANGFEYQKPSATAKSIPEAIAAARGSAEPPQTRVGFGR
jgi:hypothetical protein